MNLSGDMAVGWTKHGCRSDWTWLPAELNVVPDETQRRKPDKRLFLAGLNMIEGWTKNGCRPV